MRLLTMFMLMALFSSCTPKVAQQLHDIWALRTLDGEQISRTDQRVPTLEINLTENKIMGFNGCNEYGAAIVESTGDKIAFGDVWSTRRGCAPGDNLPQQYTSTLDKVAGYQLNGLILTLVDGDGDELMTFQKVD